MVDPAGSFDRIEPGSPRWCVYLDSEVYSPLYYGNYHWILNYLFILIVLLFDCSISFTLRLISEKASSIRTLRRHAAQI